MKFFYIILPLPSTAISWCHTILYLEIIVAKVNIFPSLKIERTLRLPFLQPIHPTYYP